MIDKKYHEEYTYNHKRIVVDIARLPSYAHPDGVYEVMVMNKANGKELACKRTPDFEEAVKVYEQMKKDFPADEQREYHAYVTVPLTGKYAKLRDDLKVALQAAAEAAEKVEDTGTCNLDAASLSLPRWNKEKVKQAAKEAGTGCFVWNLYGEKRFVFPTRVGGQALKNEKAAEAMTAALGSMGYDAFCYQQMD